MRSALVIDGDERLLIPHHEVVAWIMGYLRGDKCDELIRRCEKEIAKGEPYEQTAYRILLIATELDYFCYLGITNTKEE